MFLLIVFCLVSIILRRLTRFFTFSDYRCIMAKKFTVMASKPRSFPLDDSKEANLLREQFPYTEVPKILFDGIEVPSCFPKDIWITDTTFRDGQQARPPYKPEHIVRIFDYLHRLGLCMA